MAAEGARTVVADLNADGAKLLAEAISAAGGEATAVQVDLADNDSVRAMVQAAATAYGGLDILHNNAAATVLAATKDLPVSAADPAVWDETMRVNLRGALVAIQAEAPHMIARGGGSARSPPPAERRSRTPIPVLDLDRPEAHGRERELAPDTLLIEILQPDFEVPRTRRPDRVHEVVQLTVHPLAVDVEDLVLVATLGARGPLRQPRRKRLQPQVSGFQDVRVPGVGPDLGHSVPPGQSPSVPVGEQAPSPTVDASREAYEVAGIGPQDVAVAQLQDTDAGSEIIHLAENGLCKDGEQERMIADGETEIGGRLLVNTDGGLIGNGEPIGASGLRQIHELVRQLRGTAGARQVPGEPAVGYAHLYGAPGVSAVAILST